MEIPKSVTCPVCGVYRRKPTIHIPSTPWVDGCSCNDMGRCVYHRLNPLETPDRPSTEVMYDRALARLDKEVIDFIEETERFKDHTWMKSCLGRKNNLLKSIKDVLSQTTSDPSNVQASILAVMEMIQEDSDNDRDST